MNKSVKCCVCGSRSRSCISSTCYIEIAREGELDHYIRLPFCSSCVRKKLDYEIQANIDFCKNNIKEGYPK